MEEYLADSFPTLIDAHAHLWLRQDTEVDGLPIKTTSQGRSLFMGEVRQMLPPFMIDGRNSAEVFLANMDYAQVGGAVIVQEIIDGNQNEYLLDVAQRYPDRFRVFGMCHFDQEHFAEETDKLIDQGFYGIAIPAHRLNIPLNGAEFMRMFRTMEARHAVLSITLADSLEQIEQFEDVIRDCPDLRIAIGHFGLAASEHWEEQIKLALNPNVFIESGGITWRYNAEFYPFPSAIKALRQAIDWVGVGKLMWGSDYPRTVTAITYRMTYDFFLHAMEINEAEKRAFLGTNAQAFYNFHKLPQLPYIKNMSE